MNLLITKAELHIVNYKKRRKLHWDSVVLYLAVIQHDNVNNYCQYNPITLMVCILSQQAPGPVLLDIYESNLGPMVRKTCPLSRHLTHF